MAEFSNLQGYYVKDAYARERIALLEENFVTPQMFGAVGNGVVDDTEAFRNAITFCNENNKKLICKQGAIYLLNGKDIVVKCDIDFNWCTIKSENRNGIENLFVVEPETYADKIISNSVLTNFSTTDNELKNKSFAIVSPLSLGDRLGFENTVYNTQLLATDAQGNFINAQYYANIIEGDYNIVNIQDRTQKPLKIEKLIIEFYGENKYFKNIILCKRNNVKIDGIVLKGKAYNDAYTGAVVSFDDCFNVELGNVVGESPTAGTQAGYVVVLNNTSDVYLHDIKTSESSATTRTMIASNFVTNTLIERVMVNTIDFHYQSHNTFVVKNSEFAKMMLAGGYGQVIIEECSVVQPVGDWKTFELRNDLSLLFSGNILLKNNVFNFNWNERPVIALHQTVEASENVSPYFSDLNYKETNIIFEGNLFTNTELQSLVEVKIYDMNYSEKVNCMAINTEGNYAYLARNVVTNNFKLGTLKNVGIIFKPLLGLQQHMVAYGKVKEVHYVDCDFVKHSIMIPNTVNISGVELLDFHNTSLYILPTNAITCNVFVCVNCLVYNDRPLVVNATHKMIKNNLLVTETQNNAGSWNL